MKINLDLLKKMIAEGYVTQKNHPTADLMLFNYTPMAQYENVWNEITMQCRGLITDNEYNVIARPFVKFFNLGEQVQQMIPNESFEVFEKLDGSLGILYWIGEQCFIATRGSFVSEQANVANAILQTKYAQILPKLNKKYTYLFEIIYPENRIVVDYGTTSDLFLLAIIDTATGMDLPLEPLGFPVVQRFDGINDIFKLKAKETDNSEGFVIKFQQGLRYKVKFEEYVRIHRIITRVTSISIWEALANNTSLDELLERVPDEFYDWVKNTKSILEQQYQMIEQQCQNDFKVLANRKATAQYFLTCQYPSILFLMLDNRPYEDKIWRMIRPTFEKPFKNIETL